MLLKAVFKWGDGMSRSYGEAFRAMPDGEKACFGLWKSTFCDFSYIGKARLGMRRKQGCCVICCKLFIVNDLPKTVFLCFFRHKRIMIVPGRVFARFSR